MVAVVSGSILSWLQSHLSVREPARVRWPSLCNDDMHHVIEPILFPQIAYLQDFFEGHDLRPIFVLVTFRFVAHAVYLSLLS
jgi:hypothetical protein